MEVPNARRGGSGLRFLDRAQPQPVRLELAADAWPQTDATKQFMERREVADYQVMERFRRRVDAMVKDPRTRRKAEALLPLPVQTAAVQRHVLPGLQPAQCHADRYLRNPGAASRSPRRASRRTASSTRSIASSLPRALRCRASLNALGLRCDRWPRRRVALRSLARGPEHLARHHDARFPEPVLHRLHPGRAQRFGDRAVRPAGRAFRLDHRRNAAARRQGGRAHRRKRMDAYCTALRRGRDRHLRLPGRMHAQLLLATKARRMRRGSCSAPMVLAGMPSRSAWRLARGMASWKGWNLRLNAARLTARTGADGRRT